MPSIHKYFILADENLHKDIIRIHPPDPTHVVPVLLDTLNKRTPKNIKGKLVILHEVGFWVENDPNR